MYKKLFIPGPTHVREEILQAQTVPMIGHRAKEYSDLQAAVTPKLQEMLYTKQRVYLFASSSTGVMEGSIRQSSLKRTLTTVCGAFSKRWHEIVVDNGVAVRQARGRPGPGYHRRPGGPGAQQGRLRRDLLDHERDRHGRDESDQGYRRHDPPEVPGGDHPGGRGELHGWDQDRVRRLGFGCVFCGDAEMFRPAARPDGVRSQRPGARESLEGPESRPLLRLEHDGQALRKVADTGHPGNQPDPGTQCPDGQHPGGGAGEPLGPPPRDGGIHAGLGAGELQAVWRRALPVPHRYQCGEHPRSSSSAT